MIDAFGNCLGVKMDKDWRVPDLMCGLFTDSSKTFRKPMRGPALLGNV